MRLTIKNVKHFFNLTNINPVIRILTVSDIIFLSGLGLVSPIFAVYITDQIHGGLEVVGIAATIFLVTKSLGQLITAEIVDRIKGEYDDFWAMFAGSVLIALIPIGYMFVSSVGQLYMIQVLYGLATALTFPSWMAIFTRHIDRKKEGLEWGIYFTVTDLMAATAAAVGGYVAERFGFASVFTVAAICSALGTSYLLLVYRYLSKK